MSKVSIDLSGIEALKKDLENANGASLQVGWFESAKYDDNTPVAGVAALQEFGSKTAPPRPFFRPTIEDKKGEWSDLVEQGANAMLAGNATMNDVMNGLGLTVQADVKNTISGGQHLALSPVTLALRRLKDDGYQIGGRMVGAVAAAVAKGETGAGQLGQPSQNTDPLRETGLMLSTLTYEVGE